MPIQPKQQPPYYSPTGIIKTYKAIITQESTNPPVVVQLLQNTLGTTLTFTYLATGSYQATAGENGTFPINKTQIIMGTAYTPQRTVSAIHNEDINEKIIDISSANALNDADDCIYLSSIEINVYP